MIERCFVTFLQAVDCRVPRRGATELRVVGGGVVLQRALLTFQKLMLLSLQALATLSARVAFCSTHGRTRVMVRQCDVHDTLYFIFLI